MPDKLSQSLDQILNERRKTTGGRGRPRGRRGVAGTPAATAPVGGVKKTTRAEKKPEKAAIPTAPAGSGEGKIIVSNLVCRPVTIPYLRSSLTMVAVRRNRDTDQGTLSAAVTSFEARAPLLEDDGHLRNVFPSACYHLWSCILSPLAGTPHSNNNCSVTLA